MREKQGEAAPGVLSSVLGHLVQERQGHTGKSPVQGHQEDEGSGAPLL